MTKESVAANRPRHSPQGNNSAAHNRDEGHARFGMTAASVSTATARTYHPTRTLQRVLVASSTATVAVHDAGHLAICVRCRGAQTSQSALQAGLRVLTAVATRERLMGSEEPSESGVVEDHPLTRATYSRTGVTGAGPPMRCRRRFGSPGRSISCRSTARKRQCRPG